jgi:hypothetical protein
MLLSYPGYFLLSGLWYQSTVLHQSFWTHLQHSPDQVWTHYMHESVKDVWVNCVSQTLTN